MMAGEIKLTNGPNDTILSAYFVAFTVLPFLASVLMTELIRGPSTRRVASRMMIQVGAFMRRQPRILGFISTVGYGELLFRCMLIGGNVLVLWHGREYQRHRHDVLLREGRASFSSSEMGLQIVGMALGYNCAFNLAFLFLPATRNCAWMEFLHISYTNGVKYHIALGKMAVLTGVAHAVPFFLLWRRQGTLSQNALICFDCSLGDSSKPSTAWRNVYGELSLFFFLLVGWTSHPKVRRATFEVFYYMHHLYIIGVIFAVMHWGPLIWWLLPTLLLYLIHRTLSSWNALHAVQVCEFRALPDQIVKLVLARSTTSDGSGNFQLGQFVYLNVPAISKLQWHPFTIASSPRASTATLTILLKSLGDWTHELVAHADACNAKLQLPTILVDGFYGISLEAYEQYATVCLIGGGIGGAPLFAILEDLAARTNQEGVLRQRVHFVFTFRELALLSEIAPVLMRLRQQQQFIMHLFLTKEPSDDLLDTTSSDETRREDASIASTTQPFVEPLQPRSLRILVYVLVFSSSVLLILWLENHERKVRLSFGTKETQSRPLVLFLEIAALFVLPVLVALVLMLEGVWKGRHTHEANTDDCTTKDDLALLKQRRHDDKSPILRELLRTLNITVGQHLNVKQLLTQVHDDDIARAGHATRQPKLRCEDTIGVFFSGPHALKRATELAVSDFGSRRFDVHTEEFEL
uniref:FAD-binding FR-type domain-containing protein n=1 Tax=Globisporangium ultimum (strain ATCC 200006 / CBS 805.95 / DAOM BR144) TaxID=431595 RepID=K3WV21_GLOUD